MFIKRQLTLLIIATVVLASFFAALHGYRNSAKQLDKMFDQELESVALFISGVSSSNAVMPTQIEGDFAYQVFAKNRLISKSQNTPNATIFGGESGFDNTSFFGKRWRTFSLINNEFTIIVAHPIESRAESAESILLATITPIIISIPFIGFLIYYIIHNSLRSLILLSSQLKDRNSDDLSAIIIDNPPEELAPVITRLNQLLKRVDASFEQEKQLTANTAHELRTPISVLNLNAHNIANDYKSGNLTQQTLDELGQNVNRMAHVIEQMIALYRFTPEQFRVNKKPTNIQMVLQDLISQNFHLLEANQQSISLDAHDSLVNGEYFALTTMFENILKNAIKYSGVGAQIQVIQKQQNNRIIVQVHDSGKGVDASEYELILARFYRSKTPIDTQIKGAGLGMSIVKHIVELHEGNIKCSESFLGGLCIEIDLPSATKMASSL